ncbi:DRAP deaminase [Coemansia sp. Benny D160-2]|nr:DRAP deaminase [Coemansia sp. Benny D160-2]
MSEYTEKDVELMRMAIDEGCKCVNVETAYNVGAVITTKDKEVLTTGYSRKYPGNTHAEQCALMDLEKLKESPETQETPLENLIIYTTMEPCSTRLSGNWPCYKRILESNIDTVFIGVMEPPVFGKFTSVEELINNGIKVIHIKELDKECKDLSSHLF